MPIYPLRLQKSYRKGGFFNVTTDYARYARPDDGLVNVIIERTGQRLRARVYRRRANNNGTPRVYHRELKPHFQTYHEVMDTVFVDLRSPEEMIIRARIAKEQP